MPINDIPILAMLRERMQWQQARQQVLAENVANADTPDYQAKDLAPLDFSQAIVGRIVRWSGPIPITSPRVRRRLAIRHRWRRRPMRSDRAAIRSATKTR